MAPTLRQGKLPNFYTSMSQRICLGNKGNLCYTHTINVLDSLLILGAWE